MSSRGADWLAILNPASGRSRAAANWPPFRRALLDAGVRFEVTTSQEARECEQIARRAVLAGRRHLLAVGGDGSVHEIVNGAMNARLAASDRVAIAQVPLGTGNDWARGLGLPRTPAALATMLALGATRPHDVGVLAFPATSSRTASTRYFINVAGAGLDAHVLGQMPRTGPSRASYLLGLLRGLMGYRAARFTIDSGSTRIEDRLLVAFTMIGPYCGGGMQVAPLAKNDDGLLEVLAVRHPGLAGIARCVPKLYTGRIATDSAATQLRASRLSIETLPDVAVEADGQVVGMTPVEVAVLQGALDVPSDRS